MRTISRSKSTVVVRVSCERATGPSAKTNTAISASLFRSNHIERKCERMNLVVAAELRPGAVASGLRHEAFKRDLRAAAQFLEIGAGRNEELRNPAIIISLGEN